MLPIAGGIVLKPIATWPPTRSLVRGPVPLYETIVISAPAIAGGGARTDHTTCAGTVLDDEVLAERKREFLHNHSAHRVHTAAWRVRHDQCDGTRRICLRPDRERPRRRRAADERDERAPLHSITSSAIASSLSGT